MQLVDYLLLHCVRHKLKIVIELAQWHALILYDNLLIASTVNPLMILLGHLVR